MISIFWEKITDLPILRVLTGSDEDGESDTANATDSTALSFDRLISGGRGLLVSCSLPLRYEEERTWLVYIETGVRELEQLFTCELRQSRTRLDYKAFTWLRDFLTIFFRKLQ